MRKKKRKKEDLLLQVSLFYLKFYQNTQNLERRHSDIAPMSKEEEEENDDDWIDITRSRSLSTSSQIPLNPINVLVGVCFYLYFC